MNSLVTSVQNKMYLAHTVIVWYSAIFTVLITFNCWETKAQLTDILTVDVNKFTVYIVLTLTKQIRLRKIEITFDFMNRWRPGVSSSAGAGLRFTAEKGTKHVTFLHINCMLPGQMFVHVRGISSNRRNGCITDATNDHTVFSSYEILPHFGAPPPRCHISSGQNLNTVRPWRHYIFTT